MDLDCSDTSEILSDDTSNEKTQKVLSVPQTSSNQLPTTTHDCIHEIKQKNISSSMDNTIYSLVLYIENSLIWKATFLNKKTKKEENLFYILNVDGIDKVFCSICDGVMDEVSRKKIPIGQFLENAFDWLMYAIVCGHNSSKLTGS
ncbi:hypothetical protein WA158_003525 [Blastocystis sp. Blastoise]